MKMLGKVAVAVIGIGALIGSASAQDMRTASENVVACQSVEDALERLDCFEQAAAGLSVVLNAPVPEVVAAPAAPSPNLPAAPIETAAVASGTATVAATEAVPEESIKQSSLPSWIPRITFGSDRDVEKEPDEYQTKLTRIQVNRIGRHFFTTSEGHVWRQKEIGSIRAPKTLPADITLYQNITGGIRLRIEETNRIYGVARVE